MWFIELNTMNAFKTLYHSDMEASVYAIKTNYFTFNLLAWLFYLFNSLLCEDALTLRLLHLNMKCDKTWFMLLCISGENIIDKSHQ